MARFIRQPLPPPLPLRFLSKEDIERLLEQARRERQVPPPAPPPPPPPSGEFPTELFRRQQTGQPGPQPAPPPSMVAQDIAELERLYGPEAVREFGEVAARGLFIPVKAVGTVGLKAALAPTLLIPPSQRTPELQKAAEFAAAGPRESWRRYEEQPWAARMIAETPALFPGKAVRAVSQLGKLVAEEVPKVARKAVPVVQRGLAGEAGFVRIPGKDTLRITPSTYRGERGFLISGTDSEGRRISAFEGTREAAEAQRATIREDALKLKTRGVAQPAPEAVAPGVRYTGFERGAPPANPQEMYNWARGALQTDELSRRLTQATTAPRLTPKNRAAALKIIREAEKTHPEWKQAYETAPLPRPAEAVAPRAAGAIPEAGRPPVKKTWKFAGEEPIEAATPQEARRILAERKAQQAVQPPVEPGVAKPVPGRAEAPPAPPSAGEAMPPPAVRAGEPPVPSVSRPPVPAEGPPAPLPGITRSISLAEDMVRLAQPGAISQALDALPGSRQIYRFFVPARGLPRQQHVAWVGRSVAESAYLTRAGVNRTLALRTLDEAFGPEFKRGAKTTVSYIGPPERAQSALIGTAVDVLPNPDFYQLTAAQRNAIASIRAYQDELLGIARNQYGAAIGEFPKKEGAAFVPNVDVSESALEVMGDVFTAARVGRAKPRVWADALSRQQHTSTFKPEMNLELLYAASDEAKGQMVASEVFKASAGGLTKLEVLQKTQPRLAAKMIFLRKRLQSLRGSAGRLETKLQEAVDEFLASPVEDVDLLALREALEVKLARGPRAGIDVAAIQKEIDQVRAQIKGLQPTWKAANLSPYVFVQEGVYRYFPVKEARSLRQLLEVSRNPALSLAWEIRNIAFNLDMSPMTGVQLPLGILADPVGTARQVARGISTPSGRRIFLGGFQPSALADEMAKNMESWMEFAAVSGRPIGATPVEFAGGILRRIPGYSPINEGMFNMVTLRGKAAFDDLVRGAEKAGIPHNEAIFAASEAVHRAIPLVNPALLGQSQARAKLLRSLTISPSFLIRPPELMAEAAKALVKAGLKQTLTPKEKTALRIAATLFGTIATISVASAIYEAHKEGKDIGKAAIKALTDMSIHLPGGRQIPLGGPFRSLVNAMRPRWIGETMDYMLPFANMPRWALSRLTPAVRRQYDLIRNEDFQKRRIMTGEFPVNILQALRYEFEGAVPLSIGAWVEGWRTGASLKETAMEAGTQLLGQQLYERPGPWSLRGEWREDLRAYLNIPSNVNIIKADRKKYPKTRQEYRDANPLVEAKLFILGEVDSLSTKKASRAKAFREVVRLMSENKLKVKDIRSLEAEEWESANKKALREALEKALGEARATPLKLPTPFPTPGFQPLKPMTREEAEELLRSLQTPVPAGVR